MAVYRKPSNLPTCLRMRSDRKPFNDAKVRQAFKAAVTTPGDPDRRVRGPGRHRPRYAHRPGLRGLTISTRPEPKRDVAKAKQLLADAGYPDGLKVTLTTQQASPVPAMATILKEQLAEAGIKVDIKLMPTDVYYGADNTWLEADFAITDWGSRAYPQPYLDLAYVSGAKWNESALVDKELDT